MKRDKGNVLAFIRDETFYARHGKMLYDSGDYMGAVRHFLSVPYLDSQYFDVAMCLADSYYKLQFIDNALVTYFLLLDTASDDDKARIYIRVSEIVFLFDRDLAKLYLSLASSTANDRIVIDEAEARLNSILDVQARFDRKIRDVKEVSEDLQMRLLSEGKYDAVIELASKEEGVMSPTSREAVALSYISSDREKEGMDFLLSHRQDLTITEMCLLYMCLAHAKDSARLPPLRRQIMSYDQPCGSKIGLCLNILCMAGDVALALSLARNNLDDFAGDPRALIMYAKLLMGEGHFDEAKEVIIGIKNIDPYHRCIYDVHLDLCGKKRRLEVFEIVAILPYSSHTKIVRTAKKLFSLPQEEWKEYFSKHQDAFYYVVENNHTPVFVRDIALLVKLDDSEVENFLKYVLLSRDVVRDFKKSLILSYFRESRKRTILLTIEDTIVKYIFPPLEEVSGISDTLITVLSHVIFFFVLSYPYSSMDFSDILRHLPSEKIKKSEILLLSSFVAFEISRTIQPGTTLLSILSHFMLTEGDFYAFLEAHNLEI